MANIGFYILEKFFLAICIILLVCTLELSNRISKEISLLAVKHINNNHSYQIFQLETLKSQTRVRVLVI